MAISSRMRKRASLASPSPSPPSRLPAKAREKGRPRPGPGEKRAGRRGPCRRMLDLARLRRRALENSLTAWRRCRVSHGVRVGRQASGVARGATKTYIFVAVLVRGKMDGAVGPAADLLLDGVLVDLVVRSAV